MVDPEILVVDDDEDHRDLIVLALEPCCAPGTVATACGSRDALDWLLGRGTHAGRDVSRQPKLVILDLNLDRGSGLDVLKALRADPRTAGLPVVIHSSSSEERDVAEAYACGANGYLRKPGGFERLCASMRDLHARWVLRADEPPPP
ncbi:MAG: response regulator [Ramlibacter sp.]